MKRNFPESNGEKTPTGQCPLCYAENPYNVSHCGECNLPLPWAKAELHEREPCGHCLKCQSDNTYTTLNCWSCGARLPWANAVSPAAAQLAGKNGITMTAPPMNGAGGLNGANGYGASAPQIIKPTNFYSAGADEPNQIIDAVSLLCPPLGFVAYVTLLAQMPRQAINAARFALIGTGIWFFLTTFLFMGSFIKFGKSKPLRPAVTTASTNPETAGEIYN